ncbi:MAG: Na+/H+ antiporter NhaA, partial [Bdellovibrionales bacterium]|nr:Na+/H+ antiporter NhaA [Bdellovibrionales bacterium]
VAFVIANSNFSSLYLSTLDIKIFGLSIKYWINDGLMAIFFFLVGLEIKKELVLGHLSSPKKASLPLLAAIGGMIIPAIIYAYLNPEPPRFNGWGIPMATDIAFAIGVLALFGNKIPLALKVFLLAVAIVDDLGAILVIAFFYTNSINGFGLALASLALGGATLLRFSGVRNYFIYTAIGTVVWGGFLYSGIHATIAGVLLGLLTPTKFPSEKGSEDLYSPLEDLVHKLHPWVSYGIMPIFAFANAGVDLRGVELFPVITHPTSMGVVFGLFVGKPIGVFGVTYIFSKLKIISIPEGVNWGQILGVGFLAGIGFTMSLFISSLALPKDLEVYSKTGIIVGSLVSGFIGAIIVKYSLINNT